MNSSVIQTREFDVKVISAASTFCFKVQFSVIRFREFSLVSIVSIFWRWFQKTTSKRFESCTNLVSVHNTDLLQEVQITH